MEESRTQNRFRNASGARFTKGLFFEHSDVDKTDVVYTLKDRDHCGYPSLYRLYMELEDLTEYDFANKYLDGWEHWQNIAQASWFKDLASRWREELHLKISARALNRIKQEAQGKTRDSLMANKYLLEKGWVPKEAKATKGRPSRDQIKQAANEQALAEKELDEHFNRIQLN